MASSLHSVLHRLVPFRRSTRRESGDNNESSPFCIQPTPTAGIDLSVAATSLRPTDACCQTFELRSARNHSGQSLVKIDAQSAFTLRSSSRSTVRESTSVGAFFRFSLSSSYSSDNSRFLFFCFLRAFDFGFRLEDVASGHRKSSSKVHFSGKRPYTA